MKLPKALPIGLILLLLPGFAPRLEASDAKAPHGKHEEGEHDDHGDEKSAEKEGAHGHEGKEEGHGDHEEGGHEEEEEGGARFGEGKAITAGNKKDGIQLSAKAVQTLKLAHAPVQSSGGNFKVPFKSAVFFQDEVGVYRFKDGWYKLIEVELVSKNSTEVVVKTSELKSGDQIVTSGVPLLRAAELEAWGGSGDGHGH